MARPYVDGHCHLTDPRFAEQVEAVLARARAAGIGAWILGGVDPADWDRQAALRARHPAVLTSYGLHPWQVAAQDDAALERTLVELEQRAAQADAIGETGLDHGKRGGDAAARARQSRAFARHLEIAQAARLPVVIHCVQAHAEAVEVLGKFAHAGQVQGLVHSFSGAVEAMQAYVRMGLLISISGSVCRKGHESLKRAVAKIPPEYLVVETDAPDQAPPSVAEGALNEPRELLGIGDAIAKLRGESMVEVLARSRVNLERLFPRLAGL